MKHIFDIETTGFEPYRNEIITLACRTVNDSDLLVDKLSLKIKPERLNCWSMEAEGIHGIDLKDALKFPTKKESGAVLVGYLTKWVGQRNSFVCHAQKKMGSYFDMAHIDAFFNQLSMREFMGQIFIEKPISTMEMCKEVFPGLPEYNLPFLAKHFGWAHIPHDVDSDCEVTMKLYLKLKTMASNKMVQVEMI